MTIKISPEDIGTMIEAERLAALDEFVTHCPRVKTPEDAMALEIRQVDQVIIYKPGGIIEVSTHIIARRKIDDVQVWGKFATASSFGRRNGHLT